MSPGRHRLCLKASCRVPDGVCRGAWPLCRGHAHCLGYGSVPRIRFNHPLPGRKGEGGMVERAARPPMLSRRGAERWSPIACGHAPGTLVKKERSFSFGAVPVPKVSEANLSPGAVYRYFAARKTSSRARAARPRPPSTSVSWRKPWPSRTRARGHGAARRHLVDRSALA